MSFKTRIREWFFSLSVAERLMILVAAVISTLLLLAIVANGVRGYLSRHSFSQVEREAVLKAEEATRQAAIHEQRANRLQSEIETTREQLTTLNARAEQAERALLTARNQTANARRDYEQIRNRPFDFTAPAPDASEFCAIARDLGYPCGGAVR